VPDHRFLRGVTLRGLAVTFFFAATFLFGAAFFFAATFFLDTAAFFATVFFLADAFFLTAINSSGGTDAIDYGMSIIKENENTSLSTGVSTFAIKALAKKSRSFFRARKVSHDV
jgi:hypothetical protein